MSESKITALADAMTGEEQVSLLAGKDFWTTVPIERLGIPSIKVSDGPNGARGGGAFVGGISAAAFPVGIALGATWDIDLVGEIGTALADEARSKGARVLLAPTVNIHRSTLNGRNFECYSEDPFRRCHTNLDQRGAGFGRRADLRPRWRLGSIYTWTFRGGVGSPVRSVGARAARFMIRRRRLPIAISASTLSQHERGTPS